MLNNKFSMTQSPFYKNRNLNGKTQSISFRIPIEVHDDLKEYFSGLHDENPITNGLKDFSINILNHVCSERKIFSKLNLILLIPKTDDVCELNKKTEIIGFFNDDIDYLKSLNTENYIGDVPDYEIRYDLAPFEKNISYTSNFIVKVIQNTKIGTFYKIHNPSITSYDKLKEKLGELYPNIDLDECYIVLTHLNNYFDEFRNGQYQSNAYNNYHDGAYVFTDYDEKRKLYCCISWIYSSDFENITFNVKFMNEIEFTTNVFHSEDEDFKNKFDKILTNEDFLDSLLKNRELILEIKEMFNLEERLAKNDELLKKNFPDEYDKLHKE